VTWHCPRQTPGALLAFERVLGLKDAPLLGIGAVITYETHPKNLTNCFDGRLVGSAGVGTNASAKSRYRAEYDDDLRQYSLRKHGVVGFTRLDWTRRVVPNLPA